MTSLADKPEFVRRISARIDPDLLRKDLNLLSEKALVLGAEDSAIIQEKDIVFNPDIRRHVEEDKSHSSLHWPLDYPRDNLEEAIRAYQWAIFFRMKIGDNFPDYGGGPIQNETHRQIYLRLYEIITSLESSGFYMGYHLSLGLASGNCRSVFCADEKRCWPMVKGRTCRHPYRGRPSMEAAGIDAVYIAGKLNWLLPEEAPCPLLAGLVLIT